MLFQYVFLLIYAVKQDVQQQLPAIHKNQDHMHICKHTVENSELA